MLHRFFHNNMLTIISAGKVLNLSIIAIKILPIQLLESYFKLMFFCHDRTAILLRIIRIDNKIIWFQNKKVLLASL